MYLGFLLYGNSPAHANIENPNSPVQVKTFVEIPGYTLLMNTPASNKEIKLEPNFRARLGAQVTFDNFIGLGFGFRASQDPEERIKKGDTEYYDWRFNLNFDPFILSLYQQKYRGFFVENSSAVDPSWNSSEPFLQQPDLRLEFQGLNLTYVMSPERYSLGAALHQTSRQTASGGSILLGGAISETKVSDPTGLIHSSVRSEFGSDQDIISGKFIAVTGKAGYGHTFVYNESWFLSAAFMLGVGVQRREYELPSESKKAWRSAYKGDGILSAGYNGDKYFAGFLGYGDNTTFETESITFESTLWSLSLFFGSRL